MVSTATDADKNVFFCIVVGFDSNLVTGAT